MKAVGTLILTLLAVLYPLTWLFGVPDACRDVEMEHKRQVAEFWSDLNTDDPMPEVKVDFRHAFPVFPGLVVTIADPSINGRGMTCEGLLSVSLWYGSGTKLIYAPWPNRAAGTRGAVEPRSHAPQS